MPSHPAIVSRLPGRIRLRHPGLRAPARHHDLMARLGQLAEVTGNPAIGSLLIRFDPGDTALAERIDAELAGALAERIDAELAGAPEPAPAPPPGRPPVRRDLKRQVNQAAKIGALVSLAVSLAALPTSRRLHARAGAVFVALTLLHVGVHWRHTLR